jgi:hypothetical protein
MLPKDYPQITQITQIFFGALLLNNFQKKQENEKCNYIRKLASIGQGTSTLFRGVRVLSCCFSNLRHPRNLRIVFWDGPIPVFMFLREPATYGIVQGNAHLSTAARHPS